MVISRLPITISQPVYIFLVRLYWISEFPVVLRTFCVPVQTATATVKNVLWLMSPLIPVMINNVRGQHR